MANVLSPSLLKEKRRLCRYTVYNAVSLSSFFCFFFPPLSILHSPFSILHSPPLLPPTQKSSLDQQHCHLSPPLLSSPLLCSALLCSARSLRPPASSTSETVLLPATTVPKPEGPAVRGVRHSIHHGSERCHPAVPPRGGSLALDTQFDRVERLRCGQRGFSAWKAVAQWWGPLH